ncbi:glycosyltransferase family 2 protein [Clostridium algidicarnis]|uniref:glycosyltransferase family 2 protein n=1 Tax=Clostridium algidicarnis TaxID=37659 RepID=UPI003FD718CF
MNEPLVSIVIISYNSENHIIEALESAKTQGYKRLELIISDDSSTDLTIEKTENWLLENKERFINTKLIKSNHNTGITPNLNKGVHATTGEFLKLIAADDVLLDNCIEDLLDYVQKKSISFCFSKVLPFSDSKNTEYIEGIVKADKKNYDVFFNQSQKEQYHNLLRLNIPLSIIIGGFYSNDILKEIGYFDETYEMMDDYPTMINLAKLGYHFKLLDKYTSKYRVRDIVDVEGFKKSRRFIAHYHNLHNFRRNEIIPLMKKENMYFSILYLKVVMVLLNIEFKTSNKMLNSIMIRLRAFKNKSMKVSS